MSEPKFPVVFAVGLWAASGLAVLSYTLTAWKQTATTAEALFTAGANPLVASAAVLSAETIDKPLNRHKFTKSRG